ncbi:GAF and ANTAR domain-containing protein [Nocardioides zeae]|uniref:GAF domain-containing protein n=1 Tax=Nocardioides zeae TaxID=1457234 RepID=A0AAJ1X2T5_9ACTN|nr:GAF and ANTAR domain-containing protein [Nocardioides zeae]MDQ1104874.1 GAF domain-containing protein [Nocardioides zeae]
MDASGSTLTAAAQAIRALYRPTDVAGTLAAIVEVARLSLDDVDHVSVSLAGRDGSLETVAATDDLVRDLDRLQHDLGEGPCLHAALDAETVVIHHARHEQRWPAYMAVAVRRGVRAQVGLRLHVDDRVLGALNLYSLAADRIGDESLQLAELLAAAAATALGGVREREHLRTALESRERIGMAVGVVMERFGLDAERAFDYLARTSQHGNRKLRDVAEALLAPPSEAR